MKATAPSLIVLATSRIASVPVSRRRTLRARYPANAMATRPAIGMIQRIVDGGIHASKGLPGVLLVTGARSDNDPVRPRGVSVIGHENGAAQGERAAAESGGSVAEPHHSAGLTSPTNPDQGTVPARPAEDGDGNYTPTPVSRKPLGLSRRDRRDVNPDHRHLLAHPDFRCPAIPRRAAIHGNDTAA